jgi:signal transduction histidine kinase/tetratricopeptide (TPR) repeat protein
MKYILFLGLFLLHSVVSGQKKGQSLIDSIRPVLLSMKEDTNKIKVVAKITETYLMLDPAKGIDYAKSGLALSEKLRYRRGISRFDNLLGLLVGDTGNNVLAITYFEQSYAMNVQIGYTFGMISNLNNIGRSYQRMSDYTKALTYFFKALTIAEENKITEQIALVGTNLTSSFFAQKNYIKALEYAEMTLKYGRLSNTPNNIGKALLEIGIIREETRDSVSAKIYIDSALQVYEDMGNKPAIVQVLSEKAKLAYPDYEKAITLMQKAQVILNEIGPSSISSIGNLASLGSSYYLLALKRNPPVRDFLLLKADSCLNLGIRIAKENSNVEYLANMYRDLSRIQEEKLNYKPALDYFKTFYSINDSLFSQDKKNELAGLESKYKLDLKDNEIAINKLKLVSQRKTLLGLGIGLILLSIIGALLFWQNKMREKTNLALTLLNYQLDEANKVKLKFFGILSHDLRSPVSNLINYLHLLKNAPDLLSASEQAASRQQISQSTEDLLQTLETTLLWSKEQMEHFQPEIKSIPVRTLFDYLRKFFSHSGQPTLQFVGSENLNVLGDENYLKVIMQNLTSNAIKALRNTTNGLIEWRAVSANGETKLLIIDNGPGIGENQLKSLLSENNSFNTGNGFGFHLIRDLAHAIKFKITVDSIPGHGTTFTLSRKLSL